MSCRITYAFAAIENAIAESASSPAAKVPATAAKTLAEFRFASTEVVRAAAMAEAEVAGIVVRSARLVGIVVKSVVFHVFSNTAKICHMIYQTHIQSSPIIWINCRVFSVGVLLAFQASRILAQERLQIAIGSFTLHHVQLHLPHNPLGAQTCAPARCLVGRRDAAPPGTSIEQRRQTGKLPDRLRGNFHGIRACKIRQAARGVGLRQLICRRPHSNPSIPAR